MGSHVEIQEVSDVTKPALPAIFMEAFNTFGLSVGTPMDIDLEFAEGMFEGLWGDPTVQGFVALCDGEVIGCSVITCLPCGSCFVGPIMVSTKSANRGVGRQLVQAVLDHAAKIPAKAVVLMQGANNPKSFSLYHTAGFRPIYCVAEMKGLVRPSVEAPPGFVARHMEAADVPACQALSLEALGLDPPSLASCVEAAAGGKQPTSPWVVEESGSGRVVGYSTCLSMPSGRTLAESASAAIALFMAASQEATKELPLYFHVPIVGDQTVMTWALKAGLQISSQNWFMVVGDLQEVKGSWYFPSWNYV